MGASKTRPHRITCLVAATRRRAVVAGVDIAAHRRRPPRARRKLTVELADDGRTRSIVEAVDRAVRGAGVGEARVGGQIWSDGRPELVLVDVVVRGGFAEGLGVVKRALTAAGAQPGTRLVWRSPEVEEDRLGSEP